MKNKDPLEVYKASEEDAIIARSELERQARVFNEGSKFATETITALIKERDSLRSQVEALRSELSTNRTTGDCLAGALLGEYPTAEALSRYADDLKLPDNEDLVLHIKSLPNELTTLRSQVEQLKGEYNKLQLLVTSQGIEIMQHLDALDQLTRERDSLQVQRDQVLHLLSGGTLTDKQVTESGLGIGVLSEQRHHEHMRCKAEKERDEARAACAFFRKTLQVIADTNISSSTVKYQDLPAIAFNTLSMGDDCGTDLLSALKECVVALHSLEYWAYHSGHGKQFDSAIAHAKPFVGGGK